MLVNVSNSGDMEQFADLFSNIAVPNMQYIDNGSKVHPTRADSVTSGLSAFLQFWFNRTSVVCDNTLRILRNRVITTSESAVSRICCDFEYRGT